MVLKLYTYNVYYTLLLNRLYNIVHLLIQIYFRARIEKHTILSESNYKI